MRNRPLTAEEMAHKARWEADFQSRRQAIASQFETEAPRGERYEAEVPDTLDLAARAELALNAFIGSIEPAMGHTMFNHVFYAADPPFMTAQMDNLNAGKTLEALPQVRLMSGSERGLDEQYGYLLQVLAQSWEDGIIYTAPRCVHPWIAPMYADAANVCIIGRFLRAMVYWYEYDRNPFWLVQAEKIFDTIREKLLLHCDAEHAYARLREECETRGADPRARPEYAAQSYAYLRTGLPSWGFLPTTGYPQDLPDLGAFVSANIVQLGYTLLGVARYAAATGSSQAMDVARELANTLRSAEYWQHSECGWQDIPGICAPDRLHFSSSLHFQSTQQCVQALWEYAKLAGDTSLKEQVRSGYEWLRNFGIAEIGYFPEGPTKAHSESCCAAGMLILAVQLSLDGIGDCWEDADRYVRNAVTEYQFVDRDQLESCSRASGSHTCRLPCETDDRVIDRTLGSWATFPRVTNCPDPCAVAGGECCTQNAAQALYQAWEAIVQDQGHDTAQVNLLLNRAAPQLDLDSHLPYEGKIVIRNKTARRVFVRIPSWVSKPDVTCRVNDGEASPVQWVSTYLALDGLKPRDIAVVEFPMVERTIKRTHAVTGQTYTMQLRGNTAVSVTPRDEEAPQGVIDGSLILRRSGYYLTKGVSVRDGVIEVDVDVGEGLPRPHADFRCGIVMRHRGDWECLRAELSASKKQIFVVARPDEAVWWAYHSLAPVSDLGSPFAMTARMQGSDISLTVTDGSNRYTTAYQAPPEHDVAGRVGLYIDTWPHQPVKVTRFVVSDLDGRTLFEDGLDGKHAPGDRWDGLDARADYLYFKREHMRAVAAPMVRRTRFVPDHLIER